ncbi:nitroreductase family protein [Asticcacaulis sp. BYS171W]|uniref:Nitroreductase family protein n=1 Tax=Asticcacaulis aquaticus TaxID=2984212 RepID=A0ABT5HV29_9CAUL|nr:nitroreductase family protein [Asticcacaulis aquaticus]MDC7683767.1 nitroreductase family protein [Asticcacaulis aquaticus]
MPLDSTPLPTRRAEHAVDPVFTDRWSSRALTGEPIGDKDLFTCFEAARWAPSAFNAQPWRFVYAHRDGEGWDALLGLLNTKNRLWAYKASALIAVVSRKDFVFEDQTVPVGSHAFDTGAAWAALAHQAHLLGYSTRAIGGFDRKAAPQVLDLPDNFEAQTFVAIGRRAPLSQLDETFHTQEYPSERRPLETFIFEGRFTSVHD